VCANFLPSTKSLSSRVLVVWLVTKARCQSWLRLSDSVQARSATGASALRLSTWLHSANTLALSAAASLAERTRV